jgi:hypothetical protein
VSLNLVSKPTAKSVIATVELAQPGRPKEIQVKLRTPRQMPLGKVTVNGRPATLGGRHNDTISIATGTGKYFEVVGQSN